MSPPTMPSMERLAIALARLRFQAWQDQKASAPLPPLHDTARSHNDMGAGADSAHAISEPGAARPDRVAPRGRRRPAARMSAR